MFENFFKNWPDVSKDKSIVFTRDSFPPLEAEASLGGLVIKKGMHDYDSFRVDNVIFFASRETYRTLGLLILNYLFNRTTEELTIYLPHPASEIREITLRADYFGDHDILYTVIPESLEYYPLKVHDHPFFREGYNNRDLPFIKLTNEADMLIEEEDFRDRDHLMGFGNDVGCINFALLLLNLFHEKDEERIDLECDLGYKSVRTGSCEAWLYLGEFEEF